MALALVATMSYSDSTAVFKKRFLEVGLTEANYEAFNAEGLNTMGTFAFACNYAPGSADERPLTTLATNEPFPPEFRDSIMPRLQKRLPKSQAKPPGKTQASPAPKTVRW